MFYIRKTKKAVKHTWSIMVFRKREELFEYCNYISQGCGKHPSRYWNISAMLDFLNKHDNVYRYVRIDSVSAAKELKGF